MHMPCYYPFIFHPNNKYTEDDIFSQDFFVGCIDAKKSLLNLNMYVGFKSSFQTKGLKEYE